MRDYKLGNQLYDLRKNAKLTQEELADKIGVTDKAISKWENGSSLPTTENLRKLANIFDISVDALLTLKDSIEEDEKKIAKIVLTGGPCAGKTTAMNWIQNFFTKQGYKVLFVSESATELITGGVAPWTTNTNIDFQRVNLQLQLEKERLYEEAALNMPNSKILIVCDRGILDNKAYMSQQDFNKILRSLNLKEIIIRDNYDAIFHLVTAAKGAEQFYNLDNAARTENIEQATLLDDRLIAAWTGHPHLRIVDNSTNFEDKMKRLLKEISNYLGEPEPYEIERKFLIEYPNIEYFESLPNCSKVQIVQTYLKSNENEEVRVRQRGCNGTYTYSRTRKISVSPIKRIELEERITSEEYIEALLNADTQKSQIIKDRYCIAYDNQYIEIDVYPFWNNQAIMEIELSDEFEEVRIPEFVHVIKEVTNDSNYKNSSLASNKVKTLVQNN